MQPLCRVLQIAPVCHCQASVPPPPRWREFAAQEFPDPLALPCAIRARFQTFPRTSKRAEEP